MTTISFDLPWPSSKLSGQNNGAWYNNSGTVKAHRLVAREEAKKQNLRVCKEGDIHIRIDFYRPDKRGDRVNFPIRLKPYFDGIADALKVNDSRFVPEYHFHDGEAPGKVEVTL